MHDSKQKGTKNCLPVTITMGRFSRRQTDDIFLIFLRKLDMTLHTNCLLKYCWVNKKNISKCCLLKFLPSMQRLKMTKNLSVYRVSLITETEIYDIPYLPYLMHCALNFFCQEAREKLVVKYTPNTVHFKERSAENFMRGVFNDTYTILF